MRNSASPSRTSTDPDSYPAQVGRLSAQNDDLKQEEDHDDGSDVDHGGEQGICERPWEVGHAVTIP